MSFIEWKNKLKIKIFAPATVCHRQLGQYFSELKYWAWLPAFMVFKNEPVGDDGYYKTLLVNGKRIKPYTIIPRNAFIEIREKPQAITALITGIVGAVAAALSVSTAVAGVIVGVAAALAIGGLIMGVSAIAGKFGAKPKGSSNGTDKPTYQSNNSPSLSGAKNELQEEVVPIAFGRSLQVFNYSQFCIPLVKSGYGGNRYRVYSVAGYSNARYSDFRLGDILLSNYRPSSYSLQQANGINSFIGWDNAVTESFNKELSFDQSQAVFQSAIAYYNDQCSGTSLTITQNYNFTGVAYNSWTNKQMDLTATFVSNDLDVTLSTSATITRNDLVYDSATGSYNATKTVTISLGSYNISEYRYTTTTPNSNTRGNSAEGNLNCYLIDETVTIGEDIFEASVNQGVNSYNGDRNEIISQSPTETQYCDIHFNFPQGLYSISSSSGKRVRVSISAEVQWKRKDETQWHGMSESNIARIYTRDIDGNIGNLSSRITRNGNNFTFKTPDDINNADDNFYECVGIQFATAGQYQVKVMPIVFTKDDYWVGSIYISEIVWRLKSGIPVVDSSILPYVSQVACTFNATTQLDGEVDELGAIVFPYITNLKTGGLEQSRNPVDIIYYLLTDQASNPDPMSPDQIDLVSFKKAREWCEAHGCKCDGIVTGEIKYETVINEIASNNQLYFIPNKWGKAVLRVDTNEDGRPIKTLINAENSWDLSIVRKRGRLNRLMALRCSFINEETWSEDEITGYWYDGACHWQPEEGKDDQYYKPEKRELQYIKNADNVKRRIAYELEIENEKNTTATFNIAREVLDLEILDRVLVADYTRLNEGCSGSIEELLYNADCSQIIGFKSSLPFSVSEGMTATIRSVDISGEGFNVNTYELVPNTATVSKILFKTPIDTNTSNLRGHGFYDVDGAEIYYTGDLFMAGVTEILSMVISNIEEVQGEDFTSKITCRLY